jgi:hypothetical protein
MSKPNEWKAAANARKIRQLISNELLSLFEVHDDVPVAQHLVAITRSKGKIVGHKPDGTPIYRDPFTIKDEDFLKELESYSEDLKRSKLGEDEL